MFTGLMDYARRRSLLAEPGFTAKTIPWALDCDTRSGHVALQRLGNADDRRDKGREFPRCPELTQPELITGGEARSQFLVESAEVVALYGKAGVVATARAAKRGYFLDLLRRADSAHPGLAAAADLIEAQAERLRTELLDNKAKPTDKVTLFLDGRFPLDSDTWHAWWRAFRRSLAAAPAPEAADALPRPKRAGKAAASSGDRVCLLTGEPGEPLRVQPRIVGLADVGGLPTGDALGSFDKDAFPSFGFEQGQNAAVSEEAFTLCRSALNDLIARSSQRFPGLRVVHWFKDEVPDDEDGFTFFEAPGEGDDDAGASTEAAEAGPRTRARALLRAIRDGQRPDLGRNRYHVLTLSGAGGRVMVRDYDEGRFEDLMRAIDAWFGDLEIVRRDGDGLAHPPKLMAVAGALVRDLKDVTAPQILALWHAALHGGQPLERDTGDRPPRRRPLPDSLHAQALARVRVGIVTDESFNHARMGLLRAYHVRKGNGGEAMQPYLNPEHPDPAYHCGRLLALLAALQYSALGDVGAGVVQRYYVAASQAPALTFGRLIANAKNHLQKLEPGLAKYFDGRIAEVMSPIGDAMDRTLSLERQSVFALGYYQQIAFDRAEKARKGQEKKAARASAAAEDAAAADDAGITGNQEV